MQVGDLLMNKVGATGSGVREFVGVSTMTNLLIVDDVSDNIVFWCSYIFE